MCVCVCVCMYINRGVSCIYSKVLVKLVVYIVFGLKY